MTLAALTFPESLPLARFQNSRYGRFTPNRTAGTSPEPPGASAGEPFYACALPVSEAMPTINLPVPDRPQWAVRKSPEEKTRETRELLDASIADCAPSLKADVALRRLIENIQHVRRENERGVTHLLNEIDGLIADVMAHYMKRQGLRWVRCDCVATLADGKIQAIITLRTWQREARQFLEIHP